MENQNGSRIFSVFPYDSKQRYLTSNTKERDYFLIIPVEIIVKIFSFLSIPELRKCAEVSKYWNAITSSAILWSNISLNGISIKIQLLERILNSNVKDILFNGVKILGAENLIPPFFKTSRFDSLQKISWGNFRLDILNELLCLSPNLRYLELPFFYGHIGSSFFRQIVKLRRLERLELYNLRIKNVPEIIEIIQSVEKVEALNNILFWTNFEDGKQSEEFYESFLGKCPNLEILEIPEQHINESALNYILKMKNLKQLNIRKTTLPSSLTPPILENFKKWINLQEINIWGIDDPASVLTLLLLSPNLETLSVGGVITYSIFEQILAYKNLKKLHFIDFDLTIIHSFKSFKTFKELRLLELFNFDSEIFPKLEVRILSELILRCAKITELIISEPIIDEGLFRQILEMDKLEKLDVSSPEFPSKFNADCNLGNYRKFKKLKHLSLEFDETEFSYSNAEIILSCCKNLTNLKLNITSETIWNCIFSMIELEELCLLSVEPGESKEILNNIDTLPRLSKLKSLQMLFWEFSSNLQYVEVLLSLSGNVEDLSVSKINVTDSICRLIAAMKKLNSLHFSCVSGISDDKIEVILNGCTRLTRDKIKVVNYKNKSNDSDNNAISEM